MNETLEILDRINSFYSTAWSQLVIYTTILFVVIGIFIPLLVQLYQSKKQKIEEEQIRRMIADQIKTIKESLKGVVLSNVEQKVKELEKKVIASEGKTFHLQGTSYLNQGSYPLALGSYITSALYYIEGKDEFNLGRVLKLIAEDCLPHINKNNLSDMRGKYEKNIKELIKMLRENNENGRYTDAIDSIEEELVLAKQRNKT